MQYGAKFRMDRNVPWDKVKEGLEEDFEMNMKKLARKYKITLNCLRPWYKSVMEKVKDRTKFLRNRWNRGRIGASVRPSSRLSTATAQLHDHFVVCTVDKASNNFAFM